MKNIKISKIFGAVAFTCLALSSYAGSANNTFLVQSNISGSCALSSANNVTFPNYNMSADSTATSTFTVDCNNGTAWTATSTIYGVGKFMTGQSAGNSGDYLYYNMYSDASYTQVFGQTGSFGSQSITGVGSNSPQVINLYSKIASGQNNPRAGAYSGTVNLTITY